MISPKKSSFLLFILFVCSYLHSAAQKMEEEDRYHVGIAVGIATGWYKSNRLNVMGDSVRYSAKPHAGFNVGLYSRQRMTNFFKPFYRQKEIKNWYWQFEVSGSYRGCNYNYYEGPKDSNKNFIYNSNGKVDSYTKSDRGKFNKVTSFGLEVPVMLVWDIANKQRNQLLFGVDVNYLISWEFYKGTDPFPVYFDPGGYKEPFFDKLVNPHRWNSSGLLGYQYSSDIIGFRAMLRYGFFNLNNNIAVEYNTQTNQPTAIIRGYLIPMALDLSIIF